MLADFALIGGSDMERTVVACKLRGEGFSVFSELASRKRQKMFKRAEEEAREVLDLAKIEDQERLCYLLRQQKACDLIESFFKTPPQPDCTADNGLTSQSKEKRV